jgi:hypothetical protein
MNDDAQSLVDQCGSSVHATEALLTIIQEQKIKQAMALSCIAPGALEVRSSQIDDLGPDDQIYNHEDGTPVFKLDELFASIYFNAPALLGADMARSFESQPDESIDSDKSLGVMDCEASITVPGSLLIVSISRSIKQ